MDSAKEEGWESGGKGKKHHGYRGGFGDFERNGGLTSISKFKEISHKTFLPLTAIKKHNSKKTHTST